MKSTQKLQELIDQREEIDFQIAEELGIVSMNTDQQQQGSQPRDGQQGNQSQKGNRRLSEEHKNKISEALKGRDTRSEGSHR
jgi:hypothetical protein